MYRTVEEFVPDGTEAGVGLILQDDDDRYLFFLAGTRHQRQCPSGELFYAGIGGHREAEEDWLTCARREVKEEIGTELDIASSSLTWHVPQRGIARPLELSDRPRPFALTEMIHPPGTPRAGGLYRIVIYEGRLCGKPQILQLDEVRGVIALTEAQVIRGLGSKPTVAELVEGGAYLAAGEENVDPRVRLYPIGTASALARVLIQVKRKDSAGEDPDVGRFSPISRAAPNDEEER